MSREDNQSLFSEEYELIRRAEMSVEDVSTKRPTYKELLESYKRLLKKTEKIVRMGDSTQQKLLRARQMQELALSRYQSLISQKNDILSMITHDLKNRISPVISAASQLKDEGLDSEDAEFFLEIIHNSSMEMFSAVEATLERKTGPGDEIEPVIVEVQVSELVRQMVSQYEILAKRKNQTIHTKVEDALVAHIDGFLFSDVIDNLLSNAIKYSPENKRIWVQLESSDDYFELVVKDEGLGMTEEDLENIYQSHKRLSAKPTGDESSTGVGLSIVRRIVELHHGEISAMSEGKDKGTSFTVTMPKVGSKHTGSPFNLE